MYRVGITGGIGVGKTTVCKAFEEFGIQVYYADLETKKLYSSDTELKSEVILLFGNESYLDSGELNKQFISKKVFNDPNLLHQLNLIVHPKVFNHYEKWCALHKNEGYTLKEAAIMFESGSDKYVDAVIGISCSLETRINRIKLRDSISEQDILKKMKNQWAQEKVLSLCDYIIYNDETDNILTQVNELHTILTHKSLEIKKRR